MFYTIYLTVLYCISLYCIVLYCNVLLCYVLLYFTLYCFLLNNMHKKLPQSDWVKASLYIPNNAITNQSSAITCNWNNWHWRHCNCTSFQTNKMAAKFAERCDDVNQNIKKNSTKYQQLTKNAVTSVFKI